MSFHNMYDIELLLHRCTAWLGDPHVTNTLSSSLCYSFFHLLVGGSTDHGEYKDLEARQSRPPKYRKVAAGRRTGLTMLACSRSLVHGF